MNIQDFATVLAAIIRHNRKLLDAGSAIKDYLVPMAWGDPGLGKSDIAEAVAADLGLDLIYADLATRDPAELAGIPWVQDGKTIRCRPDWLPAPSPASCSSMNCPRPALPTSTLRRP